MTGPPPQLSTRKVLSAWNQANLPPEEVFQCTDRSRDKERQIVGHGKPLYAPEDVLAILSKGEDSILLWTEKCNADVRNLGWDNEDVVALLKHALTAGNKLPPQWCCQNPTGPVAACDAISVLRKEEHPSKDGVVIWPKYYIKFAISKTGKVVLIISCHTDEQK